MKTKKNNHILPKITVVTVSRNIASEIEKTIQSIINQTYGNIEYIIIDGGSTDGTFDIIKKYEKKIDYWVSEKDKGTFDAMNKAIKKATGEWTNFMNGGDEFFDENVLKNVFQENENHLNCHLIYGDTARVFNNFSYIKKSKPLHTIWRGMRFCHQSLFVKTNLMRKNKFSLDLLGSDFEFIYKMYLQNKKFVYLPFPISKFSEGGISTKSLFKSNYQKFKIVKKYSHLSLIKYLTYISILKLSIIMDISKKISPSIYKIYYKIKFRKTLLK